MGQDGNRSSFPASLFEMDDLDAHWDGEQNGDRPRSSRRDSERREEPSSEVKASYPPPPPPAGGEPLELDSLPPLELDLDLDDDTPSGEFAVDRARVSEPELPLIHGTSVPLEPPPLGTAATERPAFSLEPSQDPALRRTAPVARISSQAAEPALRRTQPEPLLARRAPAAPFASEPGFSLTDPDVSAPRRTATDPRFALEQQRPAEPPPTVRPGLRRSLASSPDFEDSDFTEPLLTQEESEDNECSRPTIPGDDPLLDEVRNRYATGDYSGALVMAEGILQHDGGNSLARRYADHCRMVLEQMAASRLGALDQIPRVSVESDRLRWLSLDHRAGFLLSLIDGNSSLEELLDISGMPRFEALKILCDLLDQDVILLSQTER
jgi:hypothetical protein